MVSPAYVAVGMMVHMVMVHIGLIVVKKMVDVSGYML
jgi:hypothetical protein